MLTPKLSRRGFLGVGLALVAAPAIVRAESLMRIVVPPDWRDFVRVLYGYNSYEDEWVLRYDIRAGGQLCWGRARIMSSSASKSQRSRACATFSPPTTLARTRWSI